MNPLKWSDRNADQMPSLAIDQFILYVDELRWFANANTATNADESGDAAN